MSVAVGVYAHPWDISQPDVWTKLRDRGVSEVAMAVAYHAGRWTTRQGGPLVRFLEDGVVHFRPSADYGELRPLASSEVSETGPSPLEQLLAGCAEHGLDGHAWTVLFHNSRLGRRYPQYCVQNACGDVYSYALCPSQPAVQEYGLQLARDVAAHDGLHTLELEAAGFFGYRHSSHHEKAAIGKDPYLDFLLGCCFCPACVEGMNQAGLDGAATKERVAALLRRALVDGDAMQASCFTHLKPQEDLGHDLLRQLQDFRSTVVATFLRRVREVVPESVQISSHLVPDPMFAGSQLGLPASLALPLLDGVLLTHYGQSPSSIVKQWDEWRFPDADNGAQSRVCVWPKTPEFKLDEDVLELRNAIEQRNIAGARIYHLSLVPDRTVERVCALLTQ